MFFDAFHEMCSDISNRNEALPTVQGAAEFAEQFLMAVYSRIECSGSSE